VPEEVATLRLTAKDETAAAFAAAAFNLHRVKTATDDFHHSNQEAFERGKRSVELFGMSLERALSVGAIAEFGRRAVTEFANIDRAMTMTQIRANATATQMERFKQITDDLEKAYKINSDKLVAGFNTYLQASGKTFDEALAVYPKMVAAARATQTDINEVATGIGAAARNMQLNQEQQAKTLEQLALASRRNLQDLGKYLPQITGALAGIGATGPETFQGLIAALETIRGRFNTTGEAVESLMGMVRAVTQSRDKGLAMVGREIERRVGEGQDFVVAMMQVLEANNMLTDQALRRFAGRGSGAMIALQTLRDAWPEMKKRYEELSRAQGEVDRANEKISKDTKAALEEISTSLHRIMETTGEFIAIAGVPQAITDTADAIEKLNNLIKATKEMVEKGQMDWDKLLNESGLQQQLDHFTATWAYRWSAIKDFFREGSTPGGKVGRESERTKRLRDALEELDRNAGGGQRQPFVQMGPVPFEGIDLEGRSGVWDLSGGFSRNVEDRRPRGPGTQIPGSGRAVSVPTDKQLWAAINAFNPYSDPLSITSRAGEVGTALRELIAQLKRLNDFYDTQLTEGGTDGGGGAWPSLGGYGAGGGAMGRRTGAPWYGGAAGRGIPGGAPGPAIPSDTGLGPGGGGPAPPRGGTSMAGVHPDLVSAVEEGARYGLPPGYTWQWISGVRIGGRPGSYHHAGMAPGGYGGAGDIQIFGPDGRPIPNIGTGPGYAIYEKFALAVRAAAQRRGVPFTWGGHFRSGIPFDLMHMQYGGPSAHGFDAARVQQEIDRQVGFGAPRGSGGDLASQLGGNLLPPTTQAATNVQNFMTGIAYLDLARSAPRGRERGGQHRLLPHECLRCGEGSGRRSRRSALRKLSATGGGELGIHSTVLPHRGRSDQARRFHGRCAPARKVLGLHAGLGPAAAERHAVSAMVEHPHRRRPTLRASAAHGAGRRRGGTAIASRRRADHGIKRAPWLCRSRRLCAVGRETRPLPA
jgi:hypothetical protein